MPIDRFNERYEELNNHPDWSFHGSDFPSNAELLEARNRVLARHPKTPFIVLNVGNNADNLLYVGERIDRFRFPTGIGLPDEILKKVYYENAARLLQVKT